MVFFTTEARISKDPIVGLIQEAGADDHPDKLTAIIGAAADDEGKLIIPKAITKAAEEITKDGIGMGYAPSTGIPKLAELISAEFLGRKTQEKLDQAGVYKAEVITSGGTNAISTALIACTSEDDQIITHNPHWAGYDSVALSISRKPMLNFDILNAEQNFNIDSFTTTINSVESDKLSIILNTPFDNPLGKDFGKNTWIEIAKVLKEQINKGKEVLVILDTAYLDFGPDGKDYSRLSFLVDLFETTKSDKFSLVIAGTLSKSFAMYGARIGVATLISSNKEQVASWKNTAGGVIRGTFSNASRPGQEIALNILQDMNKLADIHDFQMKTSQMLAKRRDFFVDTMSKDLPEALEIIKADSGFFISLRVADQEFALKLSEELKKNHTYVPLISNQFLRIPVCGLAEKKLEELSQRIIRAAHKLSETRLANHEQPEFTGA